jgi:hypothetical protein
MLTTGRVGHGTSFIHRLDKNLKDVVKAVNNAIEERED